MHKKSAEELILTINLQRTEKQQEEDTLQLLLMAMHSKIYNLFYIYFDPETGRAGHHNLNLRVAAYNHNGNLGEPSKQRIRMVLPLRPGRRRSPGSKNKL
jgi:hypothetical protein